MHISIKTVQPQISLLTLEFISINTKIWSYLIKRKQKKYSIPGDDGILVKILTNSDDNRSYAK
jgi:hypothetical protein